MRTAIFTSIVVFLVCTTRLSSAEEAKPAAGNGSAIKPALTPDPVVSAKIEALGDNEGAMLPPAKIAGEFNDVARKFQIDKTGPRIRNYCIKMLWAPERKRGLYLGGNHGVPHKIDDVWEFDLAADTWAMLYAPDPNRNQNGTFDDWVFKDGILQSKSGAPAQVAHTWNQITYDPEARALMWMNFWNIDGELSKLGLQDVWHSDKCRHRIPLWAFFPETNTWKPLGLDQFPFSAGNASLLEYVPELKGTLWYRPGGGSATWLFDRATDKWKYLKPGGEGAVPDEMISCFDQKNKVIVALVTAFRKDLSHNTYHYDPAANTWMNTVSVPNDSGQAPTGFDSYTVFAYDSVNGVCLLYSPQGSHKTVDDKAFGLWAYDAAVKKWTKLEPKGQMPPPSDLCTGYFDEVRNALVLIRDASTQVWAYRYKKAKK